MAQHAVEIERKWLVEQTPDLSSLKPVKINQGYIVSTADSEVRLRRQEEILSDGQNGHRFAAR